jgi:hypothetical protein
MKIRTALLALSVALSPLAAWAQNAGTTNQFPTSPWSAFAPGTVQCGWLYGANFNVTTDQAIPIAVPSGTYMIEAIAISNPSVSLTTAVGGVYSAASKGGVAVVANSQAYSSLTTNAANTTGNAMLATLAAAGTTTAFTAPTTLYLSLTTAQGAAATADVRVRCRPLY